ncbi:MAG: helix-turn-helix domain-containing protein [Prevotella sp.]|nr:helix-turn-helix domain-containing protein [Prevotella sp.]
MKNYLKAVLNQALDERKEENTGQVKENDKAEIYLSADDAAERLGISKTTLWHWSKDNKKITPIHVGRKVRYRLSDVERIIKGEVFA